ncbi:putative melatonin receptor type 1C [Apostichopus japonicus]|uniref:Putative melatonin receptor type 1C n=1 Tax=Stichopus japonicus TaxID=307972 RepID=A0A2G8L6Q4_STIJA|nr:putative melatonin receptor type 1C [Apostichopus japonicus]
MEAEFDEVVNISWESAKEFFAPYRKNDPISIIFLTWTFGMCVVGCIGNALVIGAIHTHKKLRTLGNVFLVNLAVTDTVITLFVANFGMVGILTDGYFYHDKGVLCNLIGAICMTACSCSCWSIASISVNRYVSICHRLVYPYIYNTRTVPFIVLFVWLICFLIDFPNIVDWGRHAYDPRLMMCTYDFTYRYSYTLFFIGVGFCVPLAVNIYCYTRIILFAHNSKSTIMKMSATSTKRSKMMARRQLQNSDRRLLRSVLIILCVFVLMWLPHAVMVVGDYYVRWPRILHVIGAALAHGKRSINSIIYAASNRTFREGYIMVLRLLFNKVLSCRSDVRDKRVASSKQPSIAAMSTSGHGNLDFSSEKPPTSNA